MTHVEAGAPVTECDPAAGGAPLLDLADPFALRDALRQHVLDLAQLYRVALPRANPAFYLTLALGITFPFNLALGIPLYQKLATLFSSWL